MPSGISDLDSVYVTRRTSALKLKAASRFQISPEKCHIGHLVLQAMTDNPAGINQIDSATEQSETHRSVLSRSCRLASAMQNFGLRVGDTVVVMGPNHLDVAIPYYASHFNGTTLCTVDGSIVASDLAHLFTTISPKIIFCLKSQEEKIQEGLKESGKEAVIVKFDDNKSNMETFIRDNSGTENNFRPAEFDQQETAAWLLLTSGTTGRPKCAIITYAVVAHAVEAWWYQFTTGVYNTLIIGTIQWMSAMLFYISCPIMRSARIQSSTPMTPQWLVAIINKYRPNATVWTPHLLSKFLHATAAVCDLSSFRYIIIGGSSIDKPLLDQFKQRCDAYLYLVYGMTELMIPVFDYDMRVPFGSSGRPIPGKLQYRLATEDGSDAKVGESGELLLKGDYFFKGYLNNKEETDKVLTEDGWVKTGDMFYRDEQDYYYYVERKRLLIKHTGLWISPVQLEEVIKQHPAVGDACVVGLPDQLDVEIPVAAVVKRNGANVEPEEIFALMRRELPPLKQLHGGLFFMDVLPTTPSGKIQRAQVREIAFLANRILPSKDVPPAQNTLTNGTAR
ncbi:hypothetical protein JYU34_016336 [Plutella xylostella]|uniref:Uncharacterized protein n=1 Tax=Plutella xylostella TaxID=51655 RepID=A0ABQ7Q3T8_PLUXY|nr:hypothetical protein JYU34_016336 [Plutella xylostella]